MIISYLWSWWFCSQLAFPVLLRMQIVCFSWKHLREHCAGGSLFVPCFVLCSNQAWPMLMMTEKKNLIMPE